MEYFKTLSGVLMPKIIYGTAWKKEQTADLVVQAVGLGFRGIDTACQPKHYFEAGVGQALNRLKTQGINRSDLFLQTKFTPTSGQDPQNIPYDPNAPLDHQVHQSVKSSLNNLGTDYLDSIVLHSPLSTHEQTMLVWRALEDNVKNGCARQLGVSNCYDIDTLIKIHAEATIKPCIIQNRFYKDTKYDKGLRIWCQQHNIVYQSFWTLTANPQLTQHHLIGQIAYDHNVSPEQVLFRYLTGIGIAPLTGTCSVKHMKEDLSIFNIQLTKHNIVDINKIFG